MSTKGVIFDIKKYSIHDGPGIRTTVFLKGCPLQCWWCQNPEGQNPEPEMIEKTDRKKLYNSSHSNTKEVIGREVSVEEIIREIKKDIVFYDQSGGGVTFSGGEPLMQSDFLYSLLEGCKKQGVHTAVDTSGYASKEVFDKICEMVDIFLYDLKIIDEERHLKYTGLSAEPILDNLRRLSQESDGVLIRIPIVTGITDTEINISQIVEFLSSLRNIRELGLLPYNHLGDQKYKRLGMINRMVDIPSPATDRINKIKNMFEKKGYEVRIGG